MLRSTLGLTMKSMDPLETLFDAAPGGEVPLPEALAAVYGPLRMPLHPDRQPYVAGNFVSSLDGVVALNVPGKRTGGGEIAGAEPHDHMVMGLLRALADAIVVGAGTVRAAPGHIWTADHVSKGFEDAHRELRQRLGKAPVPLNVIVTNRADLDLSRALFEGREVPVLIVTTDTGLGPLHAGKLNPNVLIVSLSQGDKVSARAILTAIQQVQPCRLILTEGGPALMGDFVAERCLDELFLTLSPQVTGRTRDVYRPGWNDGHLFAPDDPLWTRLLSIKRGGDHLFLRYGFEHRASP